MKKPTTVSDQTLIHLEDATLHNIREPIYSFTRAKVISVYDGDTITIAAEHYGAVRKFTLRIYGINCDELRGGTEATRSSAKAAKEYVTNQVLNKIVPINIMSGTKIGNKTIKDKYGRLIGSIETPDGLDLATELIRKKLAVPYFGGTKSSVKQETSD